MITNILMLFIVLLLLFMVLWKAEYVKTEDHFFNKQNTQAMRGIWCIIIMLVHVPLNQQNNIQNFIGSFAFIGVTFFFMISSYTMTLNYIDNEKFNFKYFIKRITKILFVCLLTDRVCRLIIDILINKKITTHFYLGINHWVGWLLICLIILAISQFIFVKRIKHCSYFASGLILAFSLLTFILKKNNVLSDTVWSVECLGFVFGILLATYKNKFILLFNNKWMKNIIIITLLCILVGILYEKFKTVFFVGDYILRFILDLLATLLILILNIHISIGNKCTIFLGKISYEIYIVHIYVYIIMDKLLIADNSALYIVSSIIITIIVSYIISNVVNIIFKMCNRMIELYENKKAN